MVPGNRNEELGHENVFILYCKYFKGSATYLRAFLCWYIW